LSVISVVDQLSRDISENTLSSGGVTSILGADASVITRSELMEAQTSCWVARVCGTCIVVVALNCCILAFSSGGVTSISGALVVIITLNCNDSALSSGSITSCWVASVGSLANSWSVNASGRWVARFVGTLVSIFTNNSGLNNFSSESVARVGVALVL
jgi:hypothetical protein